MRIQAVSPPRKLTNILQPVTPLVTQAVFNFNMIIKHAGCYNIKLLFFLNNKGQTFVAAVISTAHIDHEVLLIVAPFTVAILPWLI